MNLEGIAVLFVDDELNILNAIRRAVVDEPYQAFFAGSGKEALEIMAKQEIAVIITDMRMPEMDGLQLLKIVKQEYPETVRMVLSGYTQLAQVLTTVNQADIFNFITKPWDSELARVIHKAIEYYKLKKMEANMKATLEQRNTIYKKAMERMNQKIKAQQHRIHLIAQIGQYLQDTMNKENNSHLTKQLLHLMLLYSTQNTSAAFDLSDDIANMADMLKEWLESPDERLTIMQEFSGQVEGGTQFLPIVVLESLLSCGKQVPAIQHAQIACKGAAESQVVLEITLITSPFTVQWSDWIAFWQYVSGHEPLLQIKALSRKDKQVLQLQFIFAGK